MTAFNTKEYGPELTIGFITSAITSHDIHEKQEFTLLSVFIASLICTKLCKSNFLEYLANITRDKTKGRSIKLYFKTAALYRLNKIRAGVKRSFREERSCASPFPMLILMA